MGWGSYRVEDLEGRLTGEGLNVACVAWRFYWGETRANQVVKLRQ